MTTSPLMYVTSGICNFVREKFGKISVLISLSRTMVLPVVISFIGS